MMKKTLAMILFLSVLIPARSDVIFFPVEYTLLSYSFEFTYSYERVVKPKGSQVFWGGIGAVGSFFYAEYPFAGVELAIERRHYFKAGEYQRFFFSGYIGTAFVTDFRDIYDMGIVPGMKMNYKAPVSGNLVLEPYVGLSLPVTYGWEVNGLYIPFPVATVGIRIGFCNLDQKNKSRQK